MTDRGLLDGGIGRKMEGRWLVGFTHRLTGDKMVGGWIDR